MRINARSLVSLFVVLYIYMTEHHNVLGRKKCNKTQTVKTAVTINTAVVKLCTKYMGFWANKPL